MTDPQFVIGRELRRGLTVDEANTAMPLNSVDRMDREALSLRHFEEMSRAETAQSLQMEEAAAAKRVHPLAQATQGRTGQHARRIRL